MKRTLTDHMLAVQFYTAVENFARIHGGASNEVINFLINRKLLHRSTIKTLNHKFKNERNSKEINEILRKKIMRIVRNLRLDLISERHLDKYPFSSEREKILIEFIDLFDEKLMYYGVTDNTIITAISSEFANSYVFISDIIQHPASHSINKNLCSFIKLKKFIKFMNSPEFELAIDNFGYDTLIVVPTEERFREFWKAHESEWGPIGDMFLDLTNRNFRYKHNKTDFSKIVRGKSVRGRYNKYLSKIMNAF